MREHQADAEDEAEIADPVDQKGLEVGVDRRFLRVPEADQQVGHQAHRLPAEEQLQEVVAHHQHEHGEGEQRNVGEETLIAGVILHVADGVDVHHQRDEGHHQHHHRGERIDEEADFEVDPAHRHPGVHRAVERMSRQHVAEHQYRGNERHRDAGDGDDVRAGTADPAPEQPGDECAEERRQRNDEIKRLHVHPHQPFRRSRSSTLMVLRLRNSTTRMARPMAASAAATVRMKNTNTWP